MFAAVQGVRVMRLHAPPGKTSEVWETSEVVTAVSRCLFFHISRRFSLPLAHPALTIHSKSPTDRRKQPSRQGCCKRFWRGLVSHQIDKGPANRQPAHLEVLAFRVTLTPDACCRRPAAPAIVVTAGFEKGAGTFARRARRVLRTKVPDPFSNPAVSRRPNVVHPSERS